MAFGVGSCLSVLVVCIVVSTPLVQGRSLRRRHGHRSHSDYYNLEESLPRDLSGRLEDDLEHFRDSYGLARRREHPRVPDRSSEYEDSEERVPPSFRRYGQEYDSRGRESFLRDGDDFDALSLGLVARRKRHNKHDGASFYQRLGDLNAKSANNGNALHPANDNLPFELEVKQAQGRSICNYTVESIPDVRGSRVPKDLEHVRCNHIGSSCQGASTYCCVQTYRYIEVSYGNDDKETMKLYVGCVCALQIDTMQELQLSIND